MTPNRMFLARMIRTAQRGGGGTDVKSSGANRVDTDPDVSRLVDPPGGGGKMSLPFSPSDEVMCIRGPSGQGASRAEEKGARNMVFRGLPRDTKHESRPVKFFTNHYPLTTAFLASFTPRVKKNEIRLSRNSALTQAALEQRPYHLLGFLGHESRDTKHESRLLGFSRITASE